MSVCGKGLHWNAQSTKDGKCATCEWQREDHERKQAAMADGAQKAAANNHALSPRFRNKTFDNFKLSTDVLTAAKQKAAVKSCMEFVETYPKKTGMVLLGSNGTGKNHLACAIVNELQRRKGKELTALVTTAYGLLVDIRATWSKQADPRRLSESRLLDQIKRYDIMVIDEIDVKFGGEPDMLQLTHIINQRYEWQRPTIFIGNVASGDLRTHLGARIVDRLYENDTGTEENPDFVVRCVWSSHRRRTVGATA